MLRFVVVLLVAAAAIYAVFWVLDRRSRPGSGRSVLPPAPKGPDDDDAFLRDLDWERHRKARHPSERDEGDEPPAH